MRESSCRAKRNQYLYYFELFKRFYNFELALPGRGVEDPAEVILSAISSAPAQDCAALPYPQMHINDASRNVARLALQGHSLPEMHSANRHFGVLEMKRVSIVLAIAFALLFSFAGYAQTLSLNDGITLRAKTNRVGLNIGSITFYDNGQILKNLIGSFNPGFEPLINRQVWNIAKAGTTNSFTVNNIYDGAPTNYWAGATFLVFAGTPGAPEDGCTGLVASNTGPNYPTNTSVAPVITFANSCAAPLAQNDIITLTKKTFPTPESWWENSGGGLGGGGTTGKNGGREYSDTTDLCSTCGVQALTLDASAPGSESDLYYGYDGSFNVDVSVLMNGNYQLSFWAKAVSGQPKLVVSAARLSSNGFNCGTHTFALTNTWAQYTWTCSANENAATLVPNGVQIEFSTTGGVIYLDNVDWQKITSVNNPTVLRDEVIETLQNYFASSTPGPRGIFRDWTNQNGETIDNWIQPSYAHGPTGTGGGYFVGPTGSGAVGLQIEDYLVICQFLGVDPYFVFPVTASNQEGADLIEFLAGSSSTTYGAKRAALGQVEPWTSVFGTIHLSLGNEDWNNYSFDGQAIYDNHVQPNAQGDYDYTLRAGSLFAAMRSAPDYDHTKFDFVENTKTATISNPQSVARAQPDSVELEDYTLSTVDSFDTDAHMWGPAFVEPWLKVTSSQDPKNFYNSVTTYQALNVCGFDGHQPCGVNIYEWGQGTLGSSQTAQNAGTGVSQATLDIINAGAGEGIVTALQPLLNMQYFGIEAQDFFSLDQLQGATTGNVIPGSCSTTGTNCSYQTILTKLWGGAIDMGGYTNNLRPTFLGIQLVNQSIIGPMFSCPINNNLTYTSAASVNGNGDGTHDNGYRTPQLTGVPYLYSFCFENGKSRSIVLINTDLTNSHSLNFSGNNGPTGSVTQRQYAPSNLNLLNENPNGTNDQNASMKVTLTTSSLSNPTSITLPPHSVTALDYTAASAPYASTPAFSPAAGTFTGPTAISISSTPGATIYYTTNGSTPTTSSSVYSGPITVASNETLSALAIMTGFNNSAVSSSSYIIAPVLPTPTFNVAAGTYTTAQSVTIADTTSGVTIYYTTNGTTPTASSTKYTGPVTVSANETLEAIAVKSGFTNSAAASVAYVIAPVLPTPVFSLAAGTYANAQSVTISDSSTGATIYYSINHPATPSSTKYTGPITVSSTETLEAIAVQTGYTNSAIATAAYTLSGSTSYINNPSGGFSAGAFSLNNGASITSGGLLTLTDGKAGENRTAWFATAVPVQAFTTDFTFQQLNPVGDGMTFTIQGQGLTALGTSGGSLGYQGITKSVAVKFDIYSNAGEGPDSTGLYTNGASPTLPSVDLSSTGINFHSGDVMDARLVYDGTNLTMTLTDTVTNAAVTEVFPVNIPSIVGANTAYVGFTGGTGGNASTQQVLSWTYVTSGSTGSAPASTPVTATPTFSPAPGTYSGTQSVTISDSMAGSAIYYTTNGSTPTTSSTKYTGPIPVASTEKLSAVALQTGDSLSSVASGTYTITGTSTPTINIPSGGFSAGGLSLNGGASVTSGGVLTITDGGSGEGRSAWYATAVPVQTFTTDFTFQQLNPNADGMTFTIQGQGLTALGSSGGSLGYEGIPKSVAVKFDLYSNTGEGPDSTGLYTNGAGPTLPAVDLSSTGINLHSGDVMDAHFVYDGTNLTMTLTDTVTKAVVTEVFPVNIPSIVGANTAYVGFTGGTGGKTSTQQVLSWTYTASSSTTSSSGSSAPPPPPPVTATPTFSPAPGSYTGTQSVTISDSMAGSAIYYTTDGSTPTTSSTKYTGPISVASTEKLSAVALQTGDSLSGVASGTYTITGSVTYINSPSGTFSASAFHLNNGASVTSGLLQVTDGGSGENRSAWFVNTVPVKSFTTDFTFQQLNPNADGMTFTIQGLSPTAAGSAGGSLGYEGITKSVAIKLDLYSNSGEGADSTGLYTNGASPTVPSVDLTSSGINLHSGDVMDAHLVYDGTNLTLTLTDTVTKATVTHAFPVNIPGIVGANTAYVGFTGGTGGKTSTQQVLSWTYSGQ